MVVARDVADALAMTSMPPKTANRLLAEVPDLWLMGASSAELLASDLVLCHPALADAEVRARAVPVDYLGRWRLTIVAADRPGLLADTTAVMAAQLLSVRAASAVTFRRGIALHSLAVDAPGLDQTGWEQLATRLRGAARGDAPRPLFEPCGAAEVTANGTVGGRTLLTVNTVDQLGLLSAVCRTLADQDVNIEVAHVTSEGMGALDSFVIRGSVDVDDLASRLSRTGRSRLASTASSLVGAIPVVGDLVRRGLEAVI